MNITSSTSASALFQSGATRRPSPQERFEQTDTDKSGALSLEEFKAGQPGGANGTAPAGAPDADALFAEMDGDSDGQLTQAEMETAFQRMGSQMKGSLLAAQEQGGPRGAGGPPPGGPPPDDAASTEESGSSALAEMLSSAADEEDEEEDATSALITQLKDALASYASSSAGTSTSTASLSA